MNKGMKIITFHDIAKLSIQPSLCYDWAEHMIQHKKEALLPPKISLKPVDGVFCNVMPSIIPGTLNPEVNSRRSIKETFS